MINMLLYIRVDDMKKTLKLKKEFKIVLIIVMSLIILFGFKSCKNHNKEIFEFKSNIVNENKRKEEEERKKQEEYNACLNEQYNSDDDNEVIEEKKNELTSLIKKYNPGLYYLDPEIGYSYKYNEEVSFYAASTIKMLDAIYLYNKAVDSDLDLDEEVKYSRNNYMGASKEMKNYRFGDYVSLRNLIKYAITVSDNTAHNMLVDYIGFKNLKEYGRSLGATKTLIGGDYFGQIDVNDSIVYLKELYRFIKDNNKYSEELKQYFLDSEQNYLNIEEENIYAAIKYGEYNYYYHENGIVYDEHPYLVSILTTIGNNEEAFRSINKKVHELHKTFYQEREKRCKEKIYN